MRPRTQLVFSAAVDVPVRQMDLKRVAEGLTKSLMIVAHHNEY